MALGSKFIKCLAGIVVTGGVSSGLALGIYKSSNSDGNLVQQLQVPEVLRLPETEDKGVAEDNSFSDPITQNSEEFSAIKEPETEKSQELSQLPKVKQELQADSPKVPPLDSKDNLSQLSVNPLEEEDSVQKLKNREEGKNNPIEQQNPPSTVEKKPDIEMSPPSSGDTSLSKNYFLKDEEDFLEPEEWAPEDCEWIGSGLGIKLKCYWSNGEILSNSREVIFNFSEKDIIDHQLNNVDIRKRITEIDFDPSLNGGELSFILDSYETAKIKFEHKNSSDN